MRNLPPELLAAVDWVQKNMPDASQVYVNKPLTNYAFSFLSNLDTSFSDKVFPNLPVDEQTGIFWTLPKGIESTDEMRMRGPLSEAREFDWSLGQDNYRADPWALKNIIPLAMERNSQVPFSIQQLVTRLLVKKARLRRDRAFAAAFLTTGVWGLDITGNTAMSTVATGGTTVRQWDNPASTPIEDIAELATTQQVATEGQRPNRLLIGRRVWDKLKNHPQILDRLNRGQTDGAARISLADVAALFELERIIIADTMVNTANEGQAAAIDFIVNKVGLLYYATDTPQMMEPTAGLTLSWRGLGNGTANNFGMSIETYRIPTVKGLHVECNMAFGHKKVSAAHGTFLTSLVA
jgi:hypothetical protein